MGRFIGGVVRRPVTTTMVTIAFVVFGIVALLRLPIELLPNLAYPSLTIRTNYRDAAPAEVEELVTRPIEELVGAAPNLVSMESAAREGLSEVVLDFAWGTSIDYAMAEVREKLDRIELPLNVERPIVLRYDPSQEPVIRLAMAQKSDERQDLTELRRIADLKVKQTLEKIPGIAAVSIHGGDEEEIRVELDPDRLNALGLSSQDIVDAINRDNINRPGGALTDSNNRFLIRTVHDAKTTEELEQVIIRSQGFSHLRLGEVASIRRMPVERQEIALLGSSEAIEISIFREGDANTVAVSNAVIEHLEPLQQQIGRDLVVLSNQAVFIESSIREVVLNTLIGGALAVTVLFIALGRIRSTLIIAIAIPISLLATFVPLSMLDVSLNLMSLGGIALGVGMLVDNSIVVIESIDRFRSVRPDHSNQQNAISGTSEVASSVVAATLTTIAVFLPISFVSGIAGQLVRDLSYAVSLSISASMVVSLTLVPVLQGWSRSVSGESNVQSPMLLSWLIVIPAVIFKLLKTLFHQLGKGILRLRPNASETRSRTETFYPALLRFCLRWRKTVLFSVFGLSLFVFYHGRHLGRTLLPELGQGEFFVQIQLPHGTALSRTEALTRTLINQVAEEQDLGPIYARVGSVTQLASATGNLSGTHLAQINFRVSSDIEEKRRTLEGEIVQKLRNLVSSKDVELRSGQPEILSLDAPIEVHVLSDDLDAAIEYSRKLNDELPLIEGIQEVLSDDLSGRPEIDIEFDRERLGRLGMTVEQASSAIQRAILGETAGRMQTFDRQLDIRIQLPDIHRNQIADLKRIVVGLVNDTPIELGSVANLRTVLGAAEIRRMEAQRGIRMRMKTTISDLNRIAKQIQNVIKSTPPPPGVVAQLSGQAGKLNDSLLSLLFVAGLALFLVYAVMASSFESLLQPLLIMGTVPLAAIGVVVACMITRSPISAMVGIGSIILGGIVVNNAIVLVHAINRNRGRGLDLNPSIVAGARARLRPILMTTTTTILGLVPMALGFGDGAALRQPLAVTVIGGLLVSTLLTLLFIPSIYRIFPGQNQASWRN